MQISLKYHGENFESFNQLLDPINKSICAKYLRSFTQSIKLGMKLFQDIIPQFRKEKKIFKKGSGLLVRFKTEKIKTMMVSNLMK